MAAIVTLPTAPNTGVSRLGEVLLGSAVDYAQNRRADDREARLRAQRLADIESERGYERQVYAQRRGDRLDDVREDRSYQEQLMGKQAQIAMRRELVRLGYLSLQAIDDEAAVTAAVAAAQRDGVADRYKAAIESGDLAFADLGDAARVEAGLAKFSKRLADQTEFKSGMPAQAQARAAQLVGERDRLSQTAAQLEARLNESEPQPTPQQVQQRALQIARASKKPGQQPSSAEIAQAAAQAEEEIAMTLAMRWNQQRQDALVQRQLLNDRLRDVSAELNTLTNRFGVVGVATEGRAAPQLSAPPPQAAPDLATAQRNFAQTISAELAKQRAPVAPVRADMEGSQPAVPTAPPPAFQSVPSANRQQIQTRLNDAIGDTMRGVGYGVSNVLRPSSWHGNMDAAYYDLNPEVEARQLRARLAGVADQTSPTAVALKNRLFELERGAAQQATRSAQILSDPINTPLETMPSAGRRGLAGRLVDVGF